MSVRLWMKLSLILFYCLLNCCDARAILIASSPPADTPEKRTALEIFWSCWVTIFICSWTSMHPNIPPRRQGRIHALWRRIALMFWALIVPELVLTWAVKQWVAARAIEKHFKKDHKWTRTHAHFLGMGGFTLVNAVRFKPEIPKIRNIIVPVQPEMPEFIDDGQHWNRMQCYWDEMECYRKGRRRFCLDWERSQRDCTEYMYFNAEILRNRDSRPVDVTVQDYKRYETYGHSLPDAIKYLYESPGTLSFYHFRDLVQKESIMSMPTITAAEIKDRSKGDVLSKAIAILQTTSFILQLFARVVLRLPITELELVTLALASLNGIIYFFWWDKPLDVQEPVTLYFRGVLPVNRYDSDDLEQGFFASVLDALRSVLKGLSNEIGNSKPPFAILRVALRWIFYLPIFTVVSSLYAIVETSDIPPGATHVPTFYATNITSSDLDIYLVYFILPIVAVGFGGLHCLGWNFIFPTQAERILWRLSSITITAIPLVSGLVVFFIRQRLSDMKAQREVSKQNIITKCVVYSAYALLYVYVFARLSLFVQALTSLWRERRDDGVFISVDWSKYVPTTIASKVL